MEGKISEAIKNAIEGAPERKFVESLDIAFTIKDVDLKNPNNRIQEEIRLPNGRGKDIKIDSVRPLVCKPKIVPLSYTKLNST